MLFRTCCFSWFDIKAKRIFGDVNFEDGAVRRPFFRSFKRLQ